MVSKIIRTLIALSSLSLFAHDNSNTISANAGTSGLDSAHLKINHQSYFYLPSDDIIILDLNHALHRKHMQNHMGTGYRHAFNSFVIGANFYYMHTTQAKAWLHQVSPGIELFYKKWQMAYNFYLPLDRYKDSRKGTIYHSSVSEMGLKWMPRKDFSVGILPFYDHLNKRWGINSNINYIMNDRFNFGISPYYKPGSSGVLFSFGISFAVGKDVKSTHRANTFNYFIKYYPAKKPKICVETPHAITPIPEPVISYPMPIPVELEKQEDEHKDEPVVVPEVAEKEQEDPSDPSPKKPEPSHWNWRDYIPAYTTNYLDYRDYGVSNDSSRAMPSTSLSSNVIEKSFLDLRSESMDSIESFEVVSRDTKNLTQDDLLATPESTPPSSPRPPEGSPPRIYDNYIPHRQGFYNRHQSTPAPTSDPMIVIEDYTRQ